jgi:hypothetical protein
MSKEEYSPRTKLLIEMRNESERHFDKQIVYLSAGALVFSVGFVKDIIGENTVPVDNWLLITSWICFASSLIINLFSYLTSRESADNEIQGKAKSSEIYNNITKCLNWLSIMGLMVGLALFIIFAILNF